jgi:hypothetical protein
MKKLLITAITGLAVTLGSVASAHDFFLLPESFRSGQAGDPTIRATIGSSFPVPEIVVPADRVERTWVLGAGQPQLHLAGTDEQSPLLHVEGARAGELVVAVKSRPRNVEYAEDRIPLILEEYRFAPEAAEAVERLPEPRTWKVVSRRFAKTLACVQNCRGGAATDIPLDGTLEFVAEGAGREQFLLLAGGRPLANYPVDLVRSDGKRQHLTTNGEGIVHLPADANGALMLFAAFLSPPARGSERFTLDLTSLTFAR